MAFRVNDEIHEYDDPLVNKRTAFNDVSEQDASVSRLYGTSTARMKYA
jgi:hypothetical protein